MKADKYYKKAIEDTGIPELEKLTDLVSWIKFLELLTSYLGHIKRAALIPLTFLIREHKIVTHQEMNEANYPSMHKKSTTTTVLNIAHFELDDCSLYNEFKPLVVDGPGWSFVKHFDRGKNGRSTVLALKAQAEGALAKLLRKQTAYATIASFA
jgi:hypothetical protein